MTDIRSRYLEKIKQIPTVSFNKEQKAIACRILKNTKDEDLDAVYGLITQRVKTGFVFDEAPEVNHNAVALIKENEKLNINVNELNVTEHKLIIGENYDALKNLCATYIDRNGKGLIDVIYIDPPYNTEASKADGNDYKEEIEASKFIYRDKFTRDGWLNMMNERLKLARRLLSDKGVIFISIDDSEQAYLKVLCDEIFGEENFVGQWNWYKSSTPPHLSNKITKNVEYILGYEKRKDNIRYLGIKKSSASTDPFTKPKNSLKELTFPPLSINFKKHLQFLPSGIYGTDKYPNTLLNDINIQDAKNVNEAKFKNRFVWTQDNLLKELANGTKIFCSENGVLSYKKPEYPNEVPSNFIDSKVGVDTTENAGSNLEKIFGKKVFDYPKPVSLLKYLLQFKSSKTSTILDFFSGSGTTGQAVMELNAEDGGKRRFILVTNNENGIGENINRERLYRVINGKGSKGEAINWKYKDDMPCLQNNSVRVFNIETEELTLNDLEKAEKLKQTAKAEFKKLNENYDTQSDFDIYNELSALNPYTKDAK